MNTYRYTFASTCPANGEAIIYKLQITSIDRILVEHIKTACALQKRAYHEDIAKDLSAQFKGDLLLVADHHGVEITTVLNQIGVPS